MRFTAAQRSRFDEAFERILEALPPQLHEMIEQVPVIIEDRPTPKLRRELGLESNEDLFGLHTGVPLTHRSVEGESVPGEDHIFIFREAIWAATQGQPAKLEREIRITLLHEIGHHFGLDEDDLANLGYA